MGIPLRYGGAMPCVLLSDTATELKVYQIHIEIFFDSWHPYSWALFTALPQLGTNGEKLPAIDGTPPNLFKKTSATPLRRATIMP